MADILRIDASARRAGSRSRALADELMQLLRAGRPHATVATRDLFVDPVPPVDDAWIVSTFAPADAQDERSRAAGAVSDALIAQLREADTCVFALPVYNFTVPAPFKAWLDLVIRPGATVTYDGGRPVGALTGKRAFVCSASLGDYSLTGPRAHMNFHEPYLRVALGFIGITDVTFFHSHGTSPELTAATHAEAVARMRDLLAAPAGEPAGEPAGGR